MRSFGGERTIICLIFQATDFKCWYLQFTDESWYRFSSHDHMKDAWRMGGCKLLSLCADRGGITASGLRACQTKLCCLRFRLRSTDLLFPGATGSLSSVHIIHSGRNFVDSTFTDSLGHKSSYENVVQHTYRRLTNVTHTERQTGSGFFTPSHTPSDCSDESWRFGLARE